VLVRSLAVRALEGQGYAVLVAESGEAALDLLDGRPERVHLVVSDVAMTGIGGRELGRRLAEAHPDLPVLYMSGYPADEAVRNGLLEERQPFIQKPFAPDALAGAVRALLDRTGARRVQA
jgi:two-component system cell cycle sensor histidine kinase/response regulator CckA